MHSRSLQALEFQKILEIISDFCVSDMAKKRVLAFCPLPALQDIDYQQKLYKQALVWKEASSFALPSFCDISKLLPSLNDEKSVFDLDTLWVLREGLLTAEALDNSIVGTKSVADGEKAWPLLMAHIRKEALPTMSISALKRCLREDGSLHDNSSPELLSIRENLRSLHQLCLRRVKELIAQYNMAQYVQDSYMTLASDRYVLPLKANFKGRMQGIIHEYSNTGETCYFEPMFLVEHNNRLQALKREERAEEYKVMAMITGLLRQERTLISAAWERLVDVDCLLAKCSFGVKIDGHMVTITSPEENLPLNLMQARHPLLVCDEKLKSRGGAKALDLILKKSDRVLVISGGNAGGKTVCLKTLGLLVLMGHSGLPVPAKPSSSIPYVEKIHALIGDAQSLEEHVSTFTGQIAHLASILEGLSPQSLVLLDEFGAGTDPSQGAALAQAVLDTLAEKGALVATATHFPALKSYALTKEGVRAASMLFDPQTKQPLYSLAYDQVGTSQALDVAREYGMPASVLEKAAQYLLLDGEDMSALMDRLNALALEREQDLDFLAKEKKEIAKNQTLWEEKANKERKKLYDEVHNLIQSISKDLKNKKIEHKAAMKDLSAMRAQLAVEKKQEAVEEAKKVQLEKLHIGQNVWHRPWGKSAQVQEIDIRQGRIKLSMNGVSLWVDKDMVSLAKDEEQKTSTKNTKNTGLLHTSAQKSVGLRLDLRGKRADVALQELTQFLDKALLSSFSTVEIVHGRGTGALRKQVHTLLATFPSVSSYALAPEDMGGDGMTLVSFD